MRQVSTRQPRAKRLPVAAAAVFFIALIGGFGLALAHVGTVFTSRSGELASGNDAILTVLMGEAHVRWADGKSATVGRGAGNGVLIRVGDRVETRTASVAVLTYPDGSTTEIDPESRVVISAPEGLTAHRQQFPLAQQARSWSLIERFGPTYQTTVPIAVAFVRSGGYRVVVSPDGAVSVDPDSVRR